MLTWSAATEQALVVMLLFATAGAVVMRLTMSPNDLVAQARFCARYRVASLTC